MMGEPANARATSQPLAQGDPALPAGIAGQRVVWHLSHGDIVIDVRDGVVYVNGDRVDPAPAHSKA